METSSTLLCVVLMISVCYGFPFPMCQTGSDVEIPANIKRNDNYAISEPNLQIFSDLEIPCDGNLVKWTFQPRHRNISSFHLGIFRNLGNGRLDRVNQVAIDDFTVPQRLLDPTKWLQITNFGPMPVRAGDMIGMYQDDMFNPNVGIGATDQMPSGTSRPTYIFLTDGSKQDRFNISDAFLRYRTPGLTAMVSPWRQQLSSFPMPSPPLVTPPLVTSPKPVTVTTLHPKVTHPRAPFSPPPRCLSDIVTYQECYTLFRGRRAYFDSRTSTCIEFDGCLPVTSTENSFASLAHCISVCHQWNPLEVCTEIPETWSVCDIHNERYFYNPTDNTCTAQPSCIGVHHVNGFLTQNECKMCKTYAYRYQNWFQDRLKRYMNN